MSQAKKIKYKKVLNSSNVNGEFYDAENKVLYLRFARDNSEYKYDDVSKKEYDEFANADSKGKFIATITRTKKYIKL